MKLSKESLKQIIKEELQATLYESMPSGGTNYYNKLVTLMSTEEGVNQAESLYEFARDQSRYPLTDEEKTFLDNCFRLLEIGREAAKLGDEIYEIGEQLREIVGRPESNQDLRISVRQIMFNPNETNKDLLKELIVRRKELYQEIRELHDLFEQQGHLLADSVVYSEENPRVAAFRNSIRVGREVSGYFRTFN